MSKKERANENIPLDLVTFSKNEQHKMLTQLVKKIEIECQNSLKQIKHDKRWKKYLDTLLKQSKGSLIKLNQLIQTKQWVKDKYMMMINQKQIEKEKKQIDFYQTKMQQNNQEIERRKIEKANILTKRQLKRRQKQQNQKILKQHKKLKQEQQNNNRIIRQKNQRPKKKIAIIQQMSQQKNNKSLTKLKNNQTMMKRSKQKQSKHSESNKSKNKDKDKKQQLPDKTIQSLPSLEIKKKTVYKMEDLVNSSQTNKLESKSKPKDLQSLQQINKDQQNLLSPKYQALQQPNIPESRQQLIKQYLHKINILQTKQIQQMFEFSATTKQNILNNQVQFSECVKLLKSIYEQKQQKYSNLEQRLSLLQ